MPKPQCIIITGRPGSGKTTLAQKLKAQLCMPLISRDALKEGYVNTYGTPHHELPVDTNGIVTELFFEIVQRYLSGKVSVIIEAAFQHKLWAFHFDKIQSLSDPILLICEIDDELANKRHIQRGLADPRREYFHGDELVKRFKETRDIAPPGVYVVPKLGIPTIKVSTESDHEPSLEEIVDMIQGIKA